MQKISAAEGHERAAALATRSDRPLIIVVGATASGKTGFSIQLAQELAKKTGKNVEIINADSRQLYRHLNVGTAKITEEEMQGVPHHLIDALDPNEEVNIAWYKERATKIIDDCHARDVVPILVGGSMLYVSAVVDGLDPLPPGDPEVRARLEAEYDKDDGWTLYDRLMVIDPATAKAFDKQNKVYVIRALELYELTGKPPSTLKKTIPPPYDILMLGIDRPKSELDRRIELRTDQLLGNGWIEEVEGLLDKGYTAADPAMKSHGYKEIMQWLSSEERNMEALKEVINRKTKQYAKRQLTWWGNDERIMWIEI